MNKNKITSERPERLSYAQFEQKAALRHYQNSVDAARQRFRPEDRPHV